MRASGTPAPGLPVRDHPGASAGEACCNLEQVLAREPPHDKPMAARQGRNDNCAAELFSLGVDPSGRTAPHLDGLDSGLTVLVAPVHHEAAVWHLLNTRPGHGGLVAAIGGAVSCAEATGCQAGGKPGHRVARLNGRSRRSFAERQVDRESMDPDVELTDLAA